MKKLSLLFVFIAITLHSIEQNSIFLEFPPFPATISQEEIQSFIEKLDVLKESYQSRIKQMEDENEVAAQKIDAAKVAAAWSGQMSMAEIQNMQKANEDILNNQQIYTSTITALSTEKDSLLMLLNTDSDSHKNLRDEYMNKCGGESSGSEAECSGLLKKVNVSSQAILKKFYFGKESVFSAYIIEFREKISDIHQKTTTDALNTSERNMGITFPHKEDLAILKMAVDVISEMKSIYSVENHLWPL